MGLKTFRPLTHSLRWTEISDFSEITKHKPEKSLTRAQRKTGGRNCYGRVTNRRIGGGHRQRYRIIDFKRDKVAVPAVVEGIEYDPNRTARIALLKYEDGEKRYIIAPLDLKVGAKLMSGPDAELAIGNALPMKKILPGMPIHNVELKHGKGGQICRSAGMSATIMAAEGEYVMVKLPSGEVRKIQGDCYATIGQVGNLDNMNILLGKAGRARWLGKRPVSRGMARNPVDHPMGGGQGKSKGGGGWHHPESPWGKLAKGGKTRRQKKYSNSLILQRRKK
jgi:large subunit ribosomal protein L2